MIHTLNLVKNDKDELCLQLTDSILEELEWSIGDTVSWNVDPNGEYATLSKVERPTEQQYFDLLIKIEEQFMCCWQVCDDLKIDVYSNYSKALSEVYNVKFDAAWKTIEKLFDKSWRNEGIL